MSDMFSRGAATPEEGEVEVTTATGASKESEPSMGTRGLKQYRVGLVAPYRPRKGGVTSQTHLLEEGLRAEGAEVVRVDTILHSINRPGLRTLRVSLQVISVALRLARVGRACDVLHVQASSRAGFVPMLVTGPLARLLRRPVVLHFHGGTGHLWLAQYHRWLLPFFRMADRTLVVSPQLESAFRDLGVETEVFWNLVPLERFSYRERSGKDPKLVWVRHLEPVCDPMLALDVHERVCAEFPGAELTLVGDGTLRPDVEREIAHRGLGGVYLVGAVAPERVPALLDESEIFLNTSRHDGVPTSILEASAAGLPIVSTAVGGVPSMLVDGESGLLASAGDADELAARILDLLRSPDVCRRLSRGARKNAESYGWDHAASHLERIYDETVD